MKITKIVFCFFVISLLFVLFPTLNSVYALTINDLPPPPKIGKTNFKDYKIWWEKVHKELLKPNTIWFYEKANKNDKTIRSIRNIMLTKAFSNNYLDKDGSERIAIFQKKLNGDKVIGENSDKKQRVKRSQDLTNLFLQLMWSGIDMVAVDKLGYELVSNESINVPFYIDGKRLTEDAYKILSKKVKERIANGESPHKYKRKFIFPKQGKQKHFSWSSDYKNIIIPENPSLCVNEGDGIKMRRRV